MKLLEPRHNSSERLGVVGIKFFGFERKAPFVHSALTSVYTVNFLPVRSFYCLFLPLVCLFVVRVVITVF